jgi:hypothetical protein
MSEAIRNRGGQQLVCGHDVVHEAEATGFVSADPVSGQ